MTKFVKPRDTPVPRMLLRMRVALAVMLLILVAIVALAIVDPDWSWGPHLSAKLLLVAALSAGLWFAIDSWQHAHYFTAAEVIREEVQKLLTEGDALLKENAAILADGPQTKPQKDVVNEP